MTNKTTTPINLIILCSDLMATKPQGTYKEKCNQIRKIEHVINNYRLNKSPQGKIAHNLTVTFPDGTWIYYPQGTKGITAYKEIEI
ncbi:hypothetical protein F0267_17325 [Vibrio coralliilyticus]|uniref:Uncharacterized protein n=1 Tax=Vibrio coralliilyticus TaxID=190893 RepID=A0AAN0SAG8_9VIBR|nr:hypothetical protein [Vibrio coralliilyticus]AIW18699.1 hypothetical protein IX92_06410 [Vibrio coralliilyticus]NOH39982.1 hypothetical protein [Vibrio coralliilyticus]